MSCEYATTISGEFGFAVRFRGEGSLGASPAGAGVAAAVRRLFGLVFLYWGLNWGGRMGIVRPNQFVISRSAVQSRVSAPVLQWVMREFLLASNF